LCPKKLPEPTKNKKGASIKAKYLKKNIITMSKKITGTYKKIKKGV